tara:strand:+ start:40 stop:879 length:840 start_codon:yes stop_codon:yes gene_type:complete
MKVLDLFSGIGGFSLGLERAGMETVGFCEIDSFCRKVLQKHWPDVPIFEDIKELDGDEYRGSVDLVCGGFPCQPFSVAGKQRGSGDDRSLWPEMLRVIRQVQPAWVIGENVPGIIKMELDTVLSDLENAGYSCQTFNLPACSLDAHHIRARIWIVAHANSATLRDGTERGAIGRLDLQGSGNAIPAHDGKAQPLAHSDNERKLQQKGVEQEIWGWTSNSREERAVWEPEPCVGRVADGVPSRMDRLKGLGNAVVPQAAELIGRTILDVRRTFGCKTYLE